MKKILLLFTAFIVLMSSCKQKGDSKNGSKPDAGKLLKEIQSYEKQLFNENINNIDFEKAIELANKYEEYAKAFPDDTLAPEMLFKASDILMNFGKPHRTISLFKKLIHDYPEYKKVAICYFLMAFVYDDQLKDYKNAAKYYQLYLDKYPGGEFSKDAQMALKYLGKPADELIKAFEEKNK
jgi:outer membrane protein assembly factor BamD (BamD/ComL family)